jgi:hypothetical protein
MYQEKYAHSYLLHKKVNGIFSFISKNFTVVGINFVPEIILIFLLQIFYKSECVNKMFISPSVWMVPVDTPAEWPETEIWAGPKVCVAVRSFLLI